MHFAWLVFASTLMFPCKYLTNHFCRHLLPDCDSDWTVRERTSQSKKQSKQIQLLTITTPLSIMSSNQFKTFFLSLNGVNKSRDKFVPIHSWHFSLWGWSLCLHLLRIFLATWAVKTQSVLQTTEDTVINFNQLFGKLCAGLLTHKLWFMFGCNVHILV